MIPKMCVSKRIRLIIPLHSELLSGGASSCKYHKDLAPVKDTSEAAKVTEETLIFVQMLVVILLPKLMLMYDMKVRTSPGATYAHTSPHTSSQVHNTQTVHFKVSIRLYVTRRNVLECKLFSRTRQRKKEETVIF